MDDLHKWVVEITGDASWRAIATATGTTHATIQRRLENEPGAAVLEIARAYGANPVGGWIAAGILTADEVTCYVHSAELQEISDVDLAREVLRRVERRVSGEEVAQKEKTGPD